MLVYLFGVLRRLQHCTGHITTGSWKGRENLYIQFVRVLYCKLPTNGKQLPAFPLEAVLGNRTPASEVGGESATTLPPWSLLAVLKKYPKMLILMKKTYRKIFRKIHHRKLVYQHIILIEKTLAVLEKYPKICYMVYAIWQCLCKCVMYHLVRGLLYSGNFYCKFLQRLCFC